MATKIPSSNSPALRILPAYTGAHTLEDIVQDSRAIRLLWLEILINEQLDVTPWLDRADVREAYVKACRWYTTYRSLIRSVLDRAPLPVEAGPVDPRDYRTFAEALRFVAAHD
jgi:hypothetical protein